MRKDICPLSFIGNVLPAAHPEVIMVNPRSDHIPLVQSCATALELAASVFSDALTGTISTGGAILVIDSPGSLDSRPV